MTHYRAAKRGIALARAARAAWYAKEKEAGRPTVMVPLSALLALGQSRVAPKRNDGTVPYLATRRRKNLCRLGFMAFNKERTDVGT